MFPCSIWRRAALAFAFAWFLGFSARAHAGEACVSNSQQLKDAFTDGAKPQSQPFTIKLVQGVYAVPADTMVEFRAPTTLLGGYTAGCASRMVNPDNTSIGLGGANSYVRLIQRSAEPRAGITMDGLTFADGSVLRVEAGGWDADGLGDPGDVTITRSRIRNLATPPGNWMPVPVEFIAASGEVRLENVVIHAIASADSKNCSVQLGLRNEARASLNYSTMDLSNGHSLCLDPGPSEGTHQVDIYNSIVWASDGTLSGILGDPWPTDTGLDVNIYSSILHQYSQHSSTNFSGANNVVEDPRWVDPANGNYRLRATSPTSPGVNSGNPVDPLGTPTTDITGGKRWIDARPDLGAFESLSSGVLPNTVTSIANAGSGTLRQVILDANKASPLVPATIRFNIKDPASGAAACPAVIQLDAPLPPITAPIIIDGYTQPGSTPNTDAEAFNAKLCVLLKPKSTAGTLSHALQVPAAQAGVNASLVVRGLGLGGFGQPVMLLGGYEHVIAGNQFGGSVGGVALPGASWGAISIINANSLIVGGRNPADRNVIGGGNLYGIHVQGSFSSTPNKCQIFNNLIGVAANGISPLPNFTGIGLAGDGCLVEGNRIVGNSQDAILINGGSDHLIQRNVIGVGVTGDGMDNSGAGIHVTSGSGNTIGTRARSNAAGTLFGNTIRFMVNGGVLAEAGAGNVIRGNLIHDNGLSGSGMDIDLAPFGPTSNDPGDADSGPNGLQNFPQARGVAFTGGGAPAPTATKVAAMVNATLNTQPGTHRVDAYFANGCSPNGRGHAEALIGSTVAMLPAGATQASLAMKVKLPNVAINAMLALTATDAAGNTSEIGPCLPADTIFRDGHE